MMICDNCKYPATPLVEVIINRYEDHEDYDHNIQTTETEEWCLGCIAGRGVPEKAQAVEDDSLFMASERESLDVPAGSLK